MQEALNGSNWVKRHDLSSHEIEVGDIDGNGKSDIVIDFGAPYGIWIYMNDNQWVKLHDLTSGNGNASGDQQLQLLSSLYITLINKGYASSGANSTQITQKDSYTNRCLIRGDVEACMYLQALKARQDGKPYVDPVVESGDPNIDNFFYKDSSDMCYGLYMKYSKETGHCYY